ncbi:hypothetical protein AB0I51_37515 [Streptomyces sp. NPDC050549]|uniref:hypothetical protein n=1 Tax=Streptomyces sp. NPDC050549 TaxID=3155406 RepID=UPI0034421476
MFEILLDAQARPAFRIRFDVVGHAVVLVCRNPVGDDGIDRLLACPDGTGAHVLA